MVVDELVDIGIFRHELAFTEVELLTSLACRMPVRPSLRLASAVATLMLLGLLGANGASCCLLFSSFMLG